MLISHDNHHHHHPHSHYGVGVETGENKWNICISGHLTPTTPFHYTTHPARQIQYFFLFFLSFSSSSWICIHLTPTTPFHYSTHPSSKTDLVLFHISRFGFWICINLTPTTPPMQHPPTWPDRLSIFHILRFASQIYVLDLYSLDIHPSSTMPPTHPTRRIR